MQTCRLSKARDARPCAATAYTSSLHNPEVCVVSAIRALGKECANKGQCILSSLKNFVLVSGPNPHLPWPLLSTGPCTSDIWHGRHGEKIVVQVHRAEKLIKCLCGVGMGNFMISPMSAIGTAVQWWAVRAF